jgi:hypothetical protein
MRTIYALLFVAGLMLWSSLSVFTLAPPADAQVAHILSRNPEKWSLILSPELEDRVPPQLEAKSNTLIALEHRARAVSDMRNRYLWGAACVLVFSGAGFVREVIIERQRWRAELPRNQ